MANLSWLNSADATLRALAASSSLLRPPSWPRSRKRLWHTLLAASHPHEAAAGHVCRVDLPLAPGHAMPKIEPSTCELSVLPIAEGHCGR